jgi:hypothetical protein
MAELRVDNSVGAMVVLRVAYSVGAMVVSLAF